MSKPRIIEIEWDDPCFWAKGQHEASAIPGDLTAYIATVGYVVKESKKTIVLAMEAIGQDAKFEDVEFRHITHIPRSLIRSRRRRR